MKNNQEGIFNKIRGKSKAIVGAAVLSSVLSGSATKVEANDVGDERGQETKVEQSLEAREKNRTLAFLDELSRVESDEKDATAAYIDKKETARVLLGAYVLELQSGFPEGSIRLSGRVGPPERIKALTIINKYFNEFLDKKFGNGDGKLSSPETEKFTQSLKDYPGLEMLFTEMRNASLR